MIERKVYDIEINPSDETGVYAMSMVDFPAIQENFLHFGDQGVLRLGGMNFEKIDNEKRMVYGPALIPDKLIYRYNWMTDEEFYVRFKSDVIRDIGMKYMKANNHHSNTVQHDYKVDGVTTVESWFIESEVDKASHLGFNLPVGTWMIGQYVENDEVWAKVKSGEVKGFSIELDAYLAPSFFSAEQKILAQMDGLIKSETQIK